MAWVAFHLRKQGQLDGAAQPGAPIDFDADDIRLMLLDATLEPTVATVQDVADVVTNEVTGTNYARKTLTTESITLAAGVITFDADDPAVYAQSGSGFTDARYAVLYKWVTADADSPAILYYDFGANKGNVTGSLTLAFDAAGIFTLT